MFYIDSILSFFFYLEICELLFYIPRCDVIHPSFVIMHSFYILSTFYSSKCFITIHVYSLKVQVDYKNYNKNATSIIPLSTPESQFQVTFNYILAVFNLGCLHPLAETASCFCISSSPVISFN